MRSHITQDMSKGGKNQRSERKPAQACKEHTNSSHSMHATVNPQY